jgi:hypothetical protein
VAENRLEALKGNRLGPALDQDQQARWAILGLLLGAGIVYERRLLEM